MRNVAAGLTGTGIGFLAGAVLASGVGFLVGYACRGFPLRQTHAEGVLKYEEAIDPALTATYPAGHYVVSRIYVDGATPDMLGKWVLVYGKLGSRGHLETPTYPLIKAREVVIAKWFRNAPGSGESED
jgi:hypothetical protein